MSKLNEHHHKGAKRAYLKNLRIINIRNANQVLQPHQQGSLILRSCLQNPDVGLKPQAFIQISANYTQRKYPKSAFK
jgi:hypothetical protein